MPAVTTHLLHTVFNRKLRRHAGWGIAPCLYCSYTGDNRGVSECVERTVAVETRSFTVGEGKFRLEVVLVDTGRGVTVTVGSTAAGCAHVGATAQAIPRPEPGRTATVSILAVPCHRDEVPAHDIAATLATRLGVPAVASCGIHVDAATPDEIRQLVETAHEAANRAVELVEDMRRASWADEDEVVAVSRAGEPIGSVSRRDAHAGEGILHQAFSILMVEGEGRGTHLLLCRRNPRKLLWGGVLADTCAGHPKPGESLREAAERRLVEEVGIACPLTQVGHIVYREDHGDGNCECEWCAVFAGRTAVGLQVSAEEISEVRSVAFDEIDGYLDGEPEHLAPWVERALRDGGIRSALAAFARGESRSQE